VEKRHNVYEAIMDSSVSSLSSRRTRESSVGPDLTRSQILADIESQTSALGHVGLLKWQRKDLQRKLVEQKDVTDAERKHASKSRKLALRLAAQIAVKEARLKDQERKLVKAHGESYVLARRSDGVIRDLEGTLKDDLTKANALLRTLGGGDSASRTFCLLFVMEFC
jgi:hypothetical protein